MEPHTQAARNARAVPSHRVDEAQRLPKEIHPLLARKHPSEVLERREDSQQKAFQGLWVVEDSEMLVDAAE